MDGPPREAIEKLANEMYAVACEDTLEKRTEKERQALVAASRTGNATYPNTLVGLSCARVREYILTYAGALANAFTTYGVPADDQADTSLGAVALQITAGAVAWVRGELQLYRVRTRKQLHDPGGHLIRKTNQSMRSAVRKGKLRLQEQRIKAKAARTQLAPVSESKDEDAGRLIQTFLKDARAKVREATNSLSAGKRTLEQAATELELEARIWAQNLHCGLLDLLSAKGMPPKQFETRATEWACQIIVMAVEEFAVSSGGDTTDGITPVIVGRTPAVIKSDRPPQIYTVAGIVQYLEKALADYPEQYRRRNLSVYTMTHGKVKDTGALGPPASNSGRRRSAMANDHTAGSSTPMSVAALMQELSEKGRLEFSPELLRQMEAAHAALPTEVYSRIQRTVAKMNTPERFRDLLPSVFAEFGVEIPPGLLTLQPGDLAARPPARRDHSPPVPQVWTSIKGTPDKGNTDVLRGADGKLKRAVTVIEACRYGGVGQRAIQKACKKGSLESEGEGPNRRIIVQSLINYYPPENNAN